MVFESPTDPCEIDVTSGRLKNRCAKAETNCNSHSVLIYNCRSREDTERALSQPPDYSCRRQQAGELEKLNQCIPQGGNWQT